jgi:hypothetical protein
MLRIKRIKRGYLGMSPFSSDIASRALCFLDEEQQSKKETRTGSKIHTGELMIGWRNIDLFI